MAYIRVECEMTMAKDKVFFAFRYKKYISAYDYFYIGEDRGNTGLVRVFKL